MNKFFAGIIFLIFFASIVFIFFPIQNSFSEPELKELFFSAENIFVNSPAQIKGKYFYEKGITSIELNSFKKECFNQQNCEFLFTPVFFSPGTKEITLIIKSEKKEFEVKKIIKIMDSKKCINNILHGECFENRYCNQGILEFNCIKCPCKKGFECIENKCILTTLELEMIDFVFPFIAGKNKEIKIEGKIKNNSNFLIPEKTEIKTNLYLSEKIIDSKKIILNKEIPSKKVFPFFLSFDLNNLNEGTHSFIFETKFNSKTLTLTEFELKIISNTGMPPKPPENLFISSENSLITLSWSNSDETATHFNIYKSISTHSTHIPYAFLKKTQNNSIAFDFLEKGTHYFVVTSLNPFNLESEYSVPIKIEVE